jgi:hypothetical protein
LSKKVLSKSTTRRKNKNQELTHNREFKPTVALMR